MLDTGSSEIDLGKWMQDAGRGSPVDAVRCVEAIVVLVPVGASVHGRRRCRTLPNPSRQLRMVCIANIEREVQ